MPALAEYLAKDHARLEALLQNSLEDPEYYYEFRKGLLRHIAIEEKLLFPLLKEADEFRELVATLRLHHGALGALLMPKLTEQIKSAVSDILAVHNKLEEGSNGAYAQVERLASGVNLLERAIAVADVPLSSAIDKLTDLGPVKRAVERAGFDASTYFP